MAFKCRFCQKILKTKYSLNNHQKTAKYCLKKRNKNIEIKFQCDGCQKIFTQKIDLKRHISSCFLLFSKKELSIANQELSIVNQELFIANQELSRYKELWKNTNEENEKLRKELKEKDKEYQKLAIELAKKPTTQTTYNNARIIQYNNLEIISNDSITDHSQNLEITHIQNGASGIIDCLRPALEGKIGIGNIRTKTLMWKPDEEQLIKDYGGERLLRLLCGEVYKEKQRIMEETENFLNNTSYKKEEKFAIRVKVSNMFVKIGATADGKEEGNLRFKQQLVRLLVSLAMNSKKKNKKKIEEIIQMTDYDCPYELIIEESE